MLFRSVDSTDLAEVLQRVQLDQSLFIIASKTFTTQETMMNATSAREAIYEALGTKTDAAVAKHFVAVSVNTQAVSAFGIDPVNMFGFWDWVGGRYSMDSAIGLSTMIAIGPKNFDDMLAGFYAMDQHFLHADPAQNLPIRLGLLDVWYRNFLHYTSRCIAPYHSALKRYAPYLQQLEMESNGKQVDLTGQALTYGSSPVLWGEPGTNRSEEHTSELQSH